MTFITPGLSGAYRPVTIYDIFSAEAGRLRFYLRLSV